MLIITIKAQKNMYTVSGFEFIVTMFEWHVNLLVSEVRKLKLLLDHKHYFLYRISHKYEYSLIVDSEESRSVVNGTLHSTNRLYEIPVI